MRMTEGILELEAPGGMAGSFLCVMRGWDEEEQDERCWLWCSADWLRQIVGGERWCRGSDNVLRKV